MHEGLADESHREPEEQPLDGHERNERAGGFAQHDLPARQRQGA
jgi:hypothetical protein